VIVKYSLTIGPLLFTFFPVSGYLRFAVTNRLPAGNSRCNYSLRCFSA
jgi:hypothetical protein